MSAPGDVPFPEGLAGAYLPEGPASALLAERLARVVGRGGVLVGDAATAPYGRDRTGRRGADPSCVVLPATTADVARVLSLLREHRAPYRVRGTGTRLVGGAVPSAGEVVVATQRLAGVVRLDAGAREVVVRAGTTFGDLRRELAADGLDLAPGVAREPESTVGGRIATDADALRVLRDGRLRRQLLGVTGVLATGETVGEIPGATEDGSPSGEWAALLGSEGTLGVVTQARLSLVPVGRGGATLLVAAAGTAEAVRLARRCPRELRGSSAVELVESDGVEHVAEARGTHPPLAGRALLLLDCSAREGGDQLLRDRVAAWQEVRGVLAASDRDGRDALWSWRRLLPFVLADAGAARGLDVHCPARVLPDALRAVRVALGDSAPQVQLVAYGAVLDGSIRLDLLGTGSGDPDLEAAVLEAVVGSGGGVAGSGGIGRARAALAARHLGTDRLAALVRQKRALDPLLLAGRDVRLPLALLEGAVLCTREADGAGNLASVRPPVEGIVVRGDGRGRRIGFPTANVATEGPVELPDDGVYAGSVELADGSRHAAAISIGRRPTYYEDGALLLEAHLLDFDGDLYDQRVRVEVGTLVRGQLRFASTDDLVAQIGRDVDAVRTERSSAAALGHAGDDGGEGQG